MAVPGAADGALSLKPLECWGLQHVNVSQIHRAYDPGVVAVLPGIHSEVARLDLLAVVHSFMSCGWPRKREAVVRFRQYLVKLRPYPAAHSASPL